LNPDSAICPE